MISYMQDFSCTYWENVCILEDINCEDGVVQFDTNFPHIITVVQKKINLSDVDYFSSKKNQTKAEPN